MTSFVIEHRKRGAKAVVWPSGTGMVQLGLDKMDLYHGSWQL